MSSEHLESYLSGRWVRGEGVETRLVDPVKGDELATASTKGVDVKAALEFARTQGQGGLRTMSYADGELVGAWPTCSSPTARATKNRHRQFRQHQD